MNEITMKMNMDNSILSALQEDITSEDITTNSVMREYWLLIGLLLAAGKMRLLEAGKME